MAWTQITGTGKYEQDGVETVFDTSTLGEMVSNYGSRKNDVMLDFDHQSCMVAENGRPAPALGWYKAFGAVIDGRLVAFERHDDGIPAPPLDQGDGLWGYLGEVTPAGKTLLSGGQYKYLSPAFLMDDTNDRGEAIGANILSVAATNIPFQQNLQPLALGFSKSNVPRGVVLTFARGLIRRNWGVTPSMLAKQVAAVSGKNLREAQLACWRARPDIWGNHYGPKYSSNVPAASDEDLAITALAMKALRNG